MSFDVSLFQSFVRIVLIALTIFCAAMVLGVPLASVVAVLGSAGLAIGLALQGSLSNLAGGIMLVLFKPFRAGDFITTNGYSGSVVSISIFYTTIVTVTNEQVMIPNGSVSNSSLMNYSALPYRRVDLEFTASYDTDIEKVKSVMLETAKKCPQVLYAPEVPADPFACVARQDASAVAYALRVWCKNADYWTVANGLKETVKNAFDENGIVIPFPQLDIHTGK